MKLTQKHVDKITEEEISDEEKNLPKRSEKWCSVRGENVVNFKPKDETSFEEAINAKIFELKLIKEVFRFIRWEF